MHTKPEWRENALVVTATWLGSVIAMLWLVMSLTYPFGWDQGLFAWAGDVIVQGGVPYRDAWDIKGPLVYYIYAFAQWLFGVQLWSIRLVDAALLAVAAAAVFRTSVVLTDRSVSKVVTLLFVLWYASQSFWHTAQPDGWTAVAMIAAVAHLIGGRSPGVAGMAGIGVCIGLATLFKPFWALFVVLPVVHILLTRRNGRAVLIGAVVAGSLVPVGAAAGWFAAHGALGELVDVHLRFTARYAAFTSRSRIAGLADYFLFSRVMAVALPIVAFGAIVLWRRNRPAAAVLLAWLVIVVFAVTLQGRFYAYHWLPLLPPVVLLAGAGLSQVRTAAPLFANVLTVALLLACSAPIVLEEARFAAWRIGVMSRDAYYEAYGEPGNHMKAVAWLRTQGKSGSVFVYGWEGGIAWLSDRRVVSRFGFSMPLLMGAPDVRARYRAEALASLAADPPEYIITGELAEGVLGARLTSADFPELSELIQRAYRPVAQFGAIGIHEIRH